MASFHRRGNENKDVDLEESATGVDDIAQEALLVRAMFEDAGRRPNIAELTQDPSSAVLGRNPTYHSVELDPEMAIAMTPSSGSPLLESCSMR